MTDNEQAGVPGYLAGLIVIGILGLITGVTILIFGTIHYGSYDPTNYSGNHDSGIVELFWGTMTTVIAAVALLVALGVAALRWRPTAPVALEPGQTLLPELKDGV
jgi:hypothetical protein